MKKYVLVNGYISINNERLFLDINKTKDDIKSRGGWLGVFLAFIGISVLHSIKTVDYFKTFFNYFDFGLRILGGITIIVVLIYLIFLKKRKKNLILNDIQRIELDKLEFETEVSIIFNDKRRQELNFRNLENQIEPFLEELKKRNTRIKIKHL
ncbi:hypothetical protein [Polaribacter sp.]|uniref:hypothetical protein n=1 Tax=Polaribacter sp. TaxID=1920175 RepID=UPI003F6BF27E